MMSKIEGLFSTSYNYFFKYLKQHLEFSKLFEIMETKWVKILKNVKTCWTSMLSLVRCVMFKYMTLLMTMAIDGLDNDKAKANFDLFCDVQILLDFAILPLS
jgi:hypothetical protein